MPNAVELTTDAAWFVGERIGAGSFPWVLAIVAPYRDVSERAAFEHRQTAELRGAGVMSDDRIDPAVCRWIRAVCHPERWLELRAVCSGGDMLRGIVARDGSRTVVALRHAQLITFTEIEADDPRALVPLITAGLPPGRPAQFTTFTLPVRAGALADERLRHGADVAAVMDHLGVPESARPVVRAAVEGPRSYVEIVAGRRDGTAPQTTEVGVAVVDTALGRLVVSPALAFDGAWVSAFEPGTPLAVALAVDRLTDLLPGGRWFPPARLVREFVTH